MWSCQSNSLDLSKTNFETSIGKTLQGLKISRVEPQKGHWELIKSEESLKPKLIEDGTTTTLYILKEKSDEDKVNYAGIKIEEGTGGRLAEHNDKLIFANFSLNKQETFRVYEQLKNLLGPRDQVIYDSIADDRTDPEVKFILSKFQDKEIKFSKDEYGDSYVVFPVHNIWFKDNYIYKYTFLRGREVYQNDFVILSKNALQNKFIFGYHNPNDPIFNKYLK